MANALKKNLLGSPCYSNFSLGNQASFLIFFSLCTEWPKNALKEKICLIPPVIRIFTLGDQVFFVNFFHSVYSIIDLKVFNWFFNWIFAIFCMQFLILKIIFSTENLTHKMIPKNSVKTRKMIFLHFLWLTKNKQKEERKPNFPGAKQALHVRLQSR
jgi:hypothetical protein